jgi:hypothetical protein
MAEHEDGWRQWIARNMAEPAASGFQPGPVDTVTAQPPFSAGVHTVPSFDVVELLPERAQDRLRKLRQRAADLHAIIPPFAELQEASAARIGAENRVRQLQAHPQEFGQGLSPDHPSVVQAQKVLDRATRELELIKQRSEDRAAAWRAASAPVAVCDDWLRHGRPHGTILEDHETEVPKLGKNEPSLIDAIENRRRRCRELKADIHRVRSACYTKAEAMALVSATVENWGSNGIDTSATIEHLSQPTIPTKTVQAKVHNVPGAPAAVVFVEVPDVIGIFSTVLKDQFIAWLAADVDRNADPKGALSHEARQQQETELMGDLLDVERQEAALTWSAIEQSLPVQFGNINPLAILGCRLITAPRADASPETSPGLSWPWRR